jgi:pSer/pThr/pTyr-binding forkhead associated (FHA) protein
VLSGPSAGARVRIDKNRFVIGRGKSTSDLAVADHSLSRQHIAIEFLLDGYYLVDMGSTTGTEVNGRRISRHRLANNDVFSVAGNRFRYEEA